MWRTRGKRKEGSERGQSWEEKRDEEKHAGQAGKVGGSGGALVGGTVGGDSRRRGQLERSEGTREQPERG